MRVGFIGLGKLGLPCAVAAAQKGHAVYGWEKNAKRDLAIAQGRASVFSDEPGIDGALREQLVVKQLNLTGRAVVAEKCDLIFICVETPHASGMDGTQPTFLRSDFNYVPLETCLGEINPHLEDRHTVVIVSTVLPGTTRKRLAPILTNCKSLVYSPSFIAQSTVVRDYKAPEFAIVGTGEGEHEIPPVDSYLHYLDTIHDAEKLVMSWESAELAKMTYNTFIGFKVMLANTVMELCDSIPHSDCDDVMAAIAQAKHRITSDAYLKPGLGDGGGCHPRDNLAMSELAMRCRLDYDPFRFVMEARTDQAAFLLSVCDRYRGHATKREKLVILGARFKSGVKIEDGSYPLLIANMTDDLIVIRDPETPALSEPAVYLLCWPEFRGIWPAPGSVVVDPWGIGLEHEREGVEVVRVGRS